MAESVVATIDRGATKDVRVTLSHFKGMDLVHVRQYEGNPGEDRRPTHKGVCIPAAQVPELLAALQAMDALLRQNGLLDDMD